MNLKGNQSYRINIKKDKCFEDGSYWETANFFIFFKGPSKSSFLQMPPSFEPLQDAEVKR